MSAHDHLSGSQFKDIPLAAINHAPMPHYDDMHPEWREEHEDEYAEHGGTHEYVQHLANDIKNSGQREAVELRRVGDYYDIQDGNHRVAAHAVAGLTHIKALVHE